MDCGECIGARRPAARRASASGGRSPGAAARRCDPRVPYHPSGTRDSFLHSALTVPLVRRPKKPCRGCDGRCRTTVSIRSNRSGAGRSLGAMLYWRRNRVAFDLFACRQSEGLRHLNAPAAAAERSGDPNGPFPRAHIVRFCVSLFDTTKA